MKTLANCKPSEFLVQTNKIRKSVAKWLADTDIANIRKRMPVYEVMPKDASAEEKKALVERNARAEREQALKNIDAMLDAMLEEYPEETLEVIALCCFIEPDDIDNHTVSELLEAIASILSDETVMSFFTSLVRLGQKNISNTAKA